LRWLLWENQARTIKRTKYDGSKENKNFLLSVTNFFVLIVLARSITLCNKWF
jgi:hypothetical protein